MELTKSTTRTLLNGSSEIGLRESARTDEADAILVGSGINGLVSAAELAQAGWSVILLKRNADIGGFIATEERTLPGYLYDTFSSWHPLFVSGPAYAVLGELLHQHGLEYRNTEGWVTGSVADDGRATLGHRNSERKPESSTTVTDLEIPEAPGIRVIQFAQQRDDDSQKSSTNHLKPGDEDDDPLAIMW